MTMIEVHLLGLPVPIAGRAQQHVEELLREFALMQGGSTRDHDHEVPAQLLALMDALTQQFAGVGDEARARLDAAIAGGDRVIEDHVLLLPAEAGPASAELGAMLDAADDYCRRGTHLLTLSTPQDCLDYRNWYLGEVIGQLEGRPAVAWPDFPRTR